MKGQMLKRATQHVKGNYKVLVPIVGWGLRLGKIEEKSGQTIVQLWIEKSFWRRILH